MRKFFTVLWRFIAKSSADPKQTSATVKFFLLGVIAWLGGQGLELLGVICDLGGYCYQYYWSDPSILDQARQAVDVSAQAIYYALTLVSVIGTAWGAWRKMWRTATKQNRALSEV